MTKKDYITIAAEFKRVLDEGGEHSTLDKIAKSLCKSFLRDNPRFDEARFLFACGL